MNFIQMKKTSSIDFSKGDLFHLRFLSARAQAPLKDLNGALSLLGVVQPKFQEAEELAAMVGRYDLEESLAKKLRLQGVRVRDDGNIPHTAPLDFLTPESFLWDESMAWQPSEIRNFFEKNNLSAVELALDEQGKAARSGILHVGGHKLDFWCVLEAFDALEAHRSPWIDVVARRNTP